MLTNFLNNLTDNALKLLHLFSMYKYNAELAEVDSTAGGRAVLIAVIGIFLGLSWLLPVYERPGWGVFTQYHNNWARYLRVLAPLSIVLIGTFTWSKRQVYSLSSYLAVVIFFVLPLINFTIVEHTDYLIYGCLPLVVGGLVLFSSVSLTRETLLALAFWVGFVALVLVAWSIVRFGVERHLFYGRPRAHFGFLHPVDSSCALVAAGFAFYRIVARLFRNIASLRVIAKVAVITTLIYFLNIAESRNLSLMVFMALATWWLVNLSSRRSLVPQMTFFAISVVVLFYLYAGALVDAENPFLKYIDRLTSYRIMMNRTYLGNFFGSFTWQRLFGEAINFNLAPLHVRRTFSAVDSVALSLMSNFGALMMATFQIWMLWTGWVAFKEGDALKCAAWVAFFVGIAFDAQGLTTSNLLLFFMMCLFFRAELPAHNGRNAS